MTHNNIPGSSDYRACDGGIKIAHMTSKIDQQPIRRTVGRRIERDGQALTDAHRAAMSRNANYRTRAPKGLFIYYSAEEMEADRMRWRVDAVVARQNEQSR